MAKNVPRRNDPDNGHHASGDRWRERETLVAIRRALEAIESVQMGAGHPTAWTRGSQLERHLAAAYHLAWEATRSIYTMLGEHAEWWSSKFGPRLVKAANVVAGGNPSSASGVLYRRAFGNAGFLLRGSYPRMTPEQAANHIRTSYGAFDPIFAELARDAIAVLVRDAQKKADAVIKAADSRGDVRHGKMMSILTNDADESRLERIAASLARDLLWLGVEMAKREDRSLCFPTEHTRAAIGRRLSKIARPPKRQATR